ncbi:hypothetical protein BHE74_00010834, partial [Ensete ventricosum]
SPTPDFHVQALLAEVVLPGSASDVEPSGGRVARVGAGLARGRKGRVQLTRTTRRASSSPLALSPPRTRLPSVKLEDGIRIATSFGSGKESGKHDTCCYSCSRAFPGSLLSLSLSLICYSASSSLLPPNLSQCCYDELSTHLFRSLRGINSEGEDDWVVKPAAYSVLDYSEGKRTLSLFPFVSCCIKKEMAVNWKKRSNLQSFLTHTTPTVPAYPLPKVTSLPLFWHNHNPDIFY